MTKGKSNPQNYNLFQRKFTSPIKYSEVNSNGLLDFEPIKEPKKTPVSRSKRFLTNLLYMIPLSQTMKYIIPFYWDEPANIIDVNAGNRLIWKDFPYNHKDLNNANETWHIDFTDLSEQAKADIICEAQNIDKYVKKHYKILVSDFPFTDLKNGVESFGVKSKKELEHGQQKKADEKFRREFYFRYFIPPEILFQECVSAFNKVADNLVIKMGDSHKNKVLIPNHIFAILNFDKRFNPNSEFYLIDIIGYRGIYARRGGRFPFAQSVLTYYMIFKKEPDSR